MAHRTDSFSQECFRKQKRKRQERENGQMRQKSLWWQCVVFFSYYLWLFYPLIPVIENVKASSFLKSHVRISYRQSSRGRDEGYYTNRHCEYSLMIASDCEHNLWYRIHWFLALSMISHDYLCNLKMDDTVLSLKKKEKKMPCILQPLSQVSKSCICKDTTRHSVAIVANS